MRFIIAVRGAILLILAPILTFLTSVAALVALVVLRMSAVRAQMIPRIWGKLILAIGGVRVRIEGLENLEGGGPYIFAANHQSQFDIFALQGCFTVDFRWLAKKELFEVPIFGRAMRLAGYIPIDRSRGRQALVSLNEAAQRIASGTSVILFPEGTRSVDGKLQSFKTGGMVLAIKSGVPLVPMGISGTHEILPKGKLLARPGLVTIRVGKPINTKDYTARQKQDLADRVRSEVAALLD